MTWSIYPGGQLLTSYSDIWSEVNREYSHSHPLLDPKFIIPLYKHFGSEHVMLGVEKEPGGKIVSMALLEKRGKGVWQLFLPSQAQVAPAIFGNKKSATDYCRSLDELMGSLPGYVWLLGLVNQDPDYSGLVDHCNLRNFERLEHATTINISVQGSFDDYWQSRGKKLRSEIGRKFRNLEREGVSHRLVEWRDYNDMAEAVAVHGSIESAGWKGQKGTAIRRDNVQGFFYTELLQNFARTGGARVYQLYFGDKIVASQITVIQNGMMVLLKTAHDESMSAYAPGRLIDYKIMEQLFAGTEISKIEFYTNASREDSKWTTGSRDICHINYFRSYLFKRLAQAARKFRNTPEKFKAVPG
jgi:hypothetical protein